MIESVTIIGVGSLGGYLCKYLVNCRNIKKIQVIDFDTVGSENLDKSVYSSADKDEPKVFALRKKFGDKIYPVNSKYSERGLSNPNIIETDIIIDCSDEVISYHIVDLRIYVVSGKTVVYDFRRNNEVDLEYTGKYVDKMTWKEMNIIGLISSDFICGGVIESYKDSFQIYHVSLPYISDQLKQVGDNFREKGIDAIWSDDYYISDFARSEFDRSKNIFDKHHKDMIYSLDSLDGKINGITPILDPFLEENKTRDVEINYYERDGLVGRSFISKGLFKTEDDILKEITSIPSFYSPVVYVSILVNRYDKISIDLFPLTKGA